MRSSRSDAVSPDQWRRDAGVARGQAVRFQVDGEEVSAFEGECLAIALAMAGHLTLRHSPEAGTSRGFFCLMGVCQECVVEIDGALGAACLEPVREGMVVTLGGPKSGTDSSHSDHR